MPRHAGFFGFSIFLSLQTRLRKHNCAQGRKGGILFLIEGNEVKLKGVPGSPARDLTGSLKKYAKDYIPLKAIRDPL